MHENSFDKVYRISFVTRWTAWMKSAPSDSKLNKTRQKMSVILMKRVGEKIPIFEENFSYAVLIFIENLSDFLPFVRLN